MALCISSKECVRLGIDNHDSLHLPQDVLSQLKCPQKNKLVIRVGTSNGGMLLGYHFEYKEHPCDLRLSEWFMEYTEPSVARAAVSSFKYAVCCISSSGYKPLLQNEPDKIQSKLIKAVKDKYFERKSLFWDSCREGNHKQLNKQLALGVNLNHRNRTGVSGLHLAAEAGHLKCVKLLIRNGANINAKTFDKHQTPLYLACCQNKFEVVQYLLKQGANPSIPRIKGRTPLMITVFHSRVICFDILLDTNLPLEQKDSEGSTALHYAVNIGQYHRARSLLERGANPNCVDCDGETPLFDAVHDENIAMVKLLIDFGANPLFNDRGVELIGYAAYCSRKDIFLSLLNPLNARDRNWYINLYKFLYCMSVKPEAPNILTIKKCHFGDDYFERSEGGKVQEIHKWILYLKRPSLGPVVGKLKAWEAFV
ncbi:ankyrin repeat domain-containing protein [Parashewanella curva]|uniref:Ankyrin repeat domain-containing protein n=1 Tax=Parashewanella curva TaxID=2338552 RepID=A0A3L8Q0S7_9GAMM|nr:ankyrin repeat domain-containing protein [Parashewanella curva]RLV60659.1 ankyrin repeat domain-containing protein [Parashewanella curva]